MKRLLYGLLPLLVFSLVACATSSDLRAVRTELNQQLEAKLAATDARVADLQKEQEKNAATLSAMRKGQANTTADFAELRDQISSYKVPQRIVVMAHDDIPRTDSGKPRKNLLKDMVLQQQAAQAEFARKA